MSIVAWFVGSDRKGVNNLEKCWGIGSCCSSAFSVVESFMLFTIKSKISMLKLAFDQILVYCMTDPQLIKLSLKHIIPKYNLKYINLPNIITTLKLLKLFKIQELQKTQLSSINLICQQAPKNIVPWLICSPGNKSEYKNWWQAVTWIDKWSTFKLWHIFSPDKNGVI